MMYIKVYITSVYEKHIYLDKSDRKYKYSIYNTCIPIAYNILCHSLSYKCKYIVVRIRCVSIH